MRASYIITLVLSLSSIGFLLQVRQQDTLNLTSADIKTAEKLIGLDFTETERDSLLDNVRDNRRTYTMLRELDIQNDWLPALHFNPVLPGMSFPDKQQRIVWDLPKEVLRPANPEDLAFYSVAELSVLIRDRKITSRELTEFYLKRLKKHGNTLEAVVSLTEERALKQADAMDKEIQAGRYRGLLHGIPYGAKDLLAVKDTRTTWGSAIYKDQIINETATVIKKLDEAGAILVAKLSLGEFAWGDVWYGGVTKNPWNLNQGSSGSSAGSASATSAGLVPFAIGSETWGSIVSPSTRCGVTGLRPTFGRISRHGAMALSWSMDKLGPITRNALDAAIVFQAIHGADEHDPTAVSLPFNFQPAKKLKELRIGYTRSLFEQNYAFKSQDSVALDTFKKLGAQLIPIHLPDFPVNSLTTILSVEAAAAFDHLTLSNKDTMMVRQVKNAWPNLFRSSRFIPAVEYIQANRARYQLMKALNDAIDDVDLYIVPSFGGSNLLITNLTGHPSVVIPTGFLANGSPTSISLVGKLYDEASILTVAHQFQKAHPEWANMKPPLFTK